MKSTGRPDFQGWVLRLVLWIIFVAGGELVEVVPLGLDQADRRRFLVAQVHPLLVFALAGEQRVEVVASFQCLSLAQSSSITLDACAGCPAAGT